MSAIWRSRRNQRGAIVILLTLMLMTVILPLAGLAIDLTIMYVVQAKLWEAVDGAALAAGSLIGTTQESIATLAQQVCQANFPNGYWASTNLTCTSTFTPGTAANGYRFEVDVSGSVTAPTLFMKIFQLQGAMVSSTAAATRRQSRCVLVLDRSGSMGGLISSLKSIAASFATKFTAGFDELGLVVFGTSGIVGYPYKNSGPYNFNPNDLTGGPDPNFESANPNKPTGTACCDMISAINNIGAVGATNISEAMSLAYIEILKAHNRDLAANGGGLDVRSNTIVLFTDGVPNMFSAYMNSPDAQGATLGTATFVPGVLSPGNTLLPTKTPYPSGTPTPTSGYTGCYYNWPSNQYNASNNARGITYAQAGANQMIGVIGSGGMPSNSSNNNGLIQMASNDTSTCAGGSGSSSWSLCFVKNDDAFTNAIDNTNAVLKCNVLGNANNNPSLDTTPGDLNNLPAWDLYGNYLSGLGSPAGYSYSGAVSFPSSTTYNPTIKNVTGNSLAQQLNIAAWNAADNAANLIRSDSRNNITIYTIGYSGNGGTDDVLLARIANDPTQATYPQAGCGTSSRYATGSNGYNSSQRQGQYFAACDSNAISNAFAKIAGILLNISR